MGEGTSGGASRGGRRRALAKWALLVVGGFLLLLCAVLVAVDAYTAARLRAAKESAAAEGSLLTMDELLSRRTPLADDENAATYYREAFKALDGIGYKPGSDFVPIVSRALERMTSDDQALRKAIEDYRLINEDPRLPLPEYMLEAARDYVSERREVISLLERASRFPRGRYDAEWEESGADLPHLTKLREAKRMVSVGVLVDAAENRPAEAVEKIRLSLKMARSLEEDPALISALVEMAMVSMSLRDLSGAAARMEIPNADLVQLQQDVEDLATDFNLGGPVQGELVRFCRILDGIIDGTLPGAENALVPAKGKVNRFARGYFRMDEAAGIEYLAKLISIAEKPTAASLTSMNEVVSEAEGSRYRHRLSKSIVEPIARGVIQGEKIRARLRCTAAAIAAMRYRNDEGRWPERLEALVPGYMAAVPYDVFADGPVVCRMRDEGIVVYSVGQNGRDDGGRGPGLDSLVGEGGAEDDVGTRIWK